MRTINSKLPALILVGLICLISSTGYSYFASQETVTITVIEKERILETHGKQLTAKYLVFAEGEVFENTDSLWFFKFDSSGVQLQLRNGEEYTVDVVGWRIPFLSMYRNIIRVH